MVEKASKKTLIEHSIPAFLVKNLKNNLEISYQKRSPSIIHDSCCLLTILIVFDAFLG